MIQKPLACISVAGGEEVKLSFGQEWATILDFAIFGQSRRSGWLTSRQGLLVALSQGVEKTIGRWLNQRWLERCVKKYMRIMLRGNRF